MSGIFNNKQRVIDALLTLEGKRQLSRGDMRIEFYTFSDTGTLYKADLASGSADATERIYLEASQLPQDQITFEANDAGRLQPFNNSLGNVIKDGQIISYSFTATTSSLFTGSFENATILKGSEFASVTPAMLNESAENYKNLQLIATKDRLFEDDGFGAGPNNLSYVVHNKRPISDANQWIANINEVESLFNDPRLSNIPNFAYLPPVNKIDGDVDKTDYRSTKEFHLGSYPPWGRTQLFPLTWAQIESELSFYSSQGYCRTVKFDPTSKNNRLMIQIFEKSYSKLKKLDVIDYGQLRTGNPTSPLVHVFFVGKVFVDEKDTNTFVHLFTLVFE